MSEPDYDYDEVPSNWGGPPYPIEPKPDIASLSRPGTRLERALKAKNAYIPKKLVAEVHDALLAMAVEAKPPVERSDIMSLTTSNLQRIKPVFETSYTEPVKVSLKIENIKYVLGGDLLVSWSSDDKNEVKAQAIYAGHINEYIRAHGMGDRLKMDNNQHKTELVGDLKDVVAAFCDGFIKKLSPHNAVDYTAILAEGPALAKSWTERG